MEMKLERMNRRGNAVYKEKTGERTWVYTICGRDGVELARIEFKDGEESGRKIRNGDLLEIVRDRLRSYNAGIAVNSRSRNAEARVTEAIMWTDMPSSYAAKKDEPNTTNITETEES